MIGYRPDSDVGGGAFYWDASRLKSDHNGGTVISPTVPWDGAQATLDDFLGGVGETDLSGVGCWVQSRSDPLDLASFVALANGAYQKPIIDFPNTAGRSMDLRGDTYTYTGTFAPTATFYNGQIAATNRNFDFTGRTNESPARVLQGRARIDYNSATSVCAFVPESIVLAGFRFVGTYRKHSGRSIATGINGKAV